MGAPRTADGRTGRATVGRHGMTRSVRPSPRVPSNLRAIVSYHISYRIIYCFPTARPGLNSLVRPALRLQAMLDPSERLQNMQPARVQTASARY